MVAIAPSFWAFFKLPLLLFNVARTVAVPASLRARNSEVWHDTNLVDPASSHMLVSKIKPCMSQYKLLHGETANGSLKQLSFIWWSFITWITMVILELIHAPRPDFVEGLCLLGTEPTQALPGPLVIHDNRTNRMA